MPSLKSAIRALSGTFAAGVLAAIRSASLAEILEGGAAPTPTKRGPGRPRTATVVDGGGGQPDPLSTPTKPKSGRGGRLARRSASDIEHIVGMVVAKLGEHKAGLRSEQLQQVLKLSKKEIVRPIELALKAKKIVKTGKKRSTTYFAR